MRILLDQNIPAPLRHALTGHLVETAYEKGWSELTNGELLSAAESAGFDLLVSADRGVRYQQNLSKRTISLLILSSNDWTRIRKHQSLVVSSVSAIQAGGYLEVEIPPG